MKTETAKQLQRERKAEQIADRKERMVRRLKEALARPTTNSLGDLKTQAEVALAGFEEAAKEQIADHKERMKELRTAGCV